MKRKRIQKLFLEQLRKIPIIQVCCEKLDISRVSIRNWRKADAAFDKAVEDAITEGEGILNDLGEAQLVSLMKDKHWPSIAFWLRKRHPKFLDRLEITGTLHAPEEALSPERQALVEEALRRLELKSPKPDIDPDPDQILSQP